MEPDYYWGEVSTLRNGEPWSGDIRGSKRDGLLDIRAYNYTSPGISDESILINRVPNKVGHYGIPLFPPINSGDEIFARFFTLVGGDALEGVYNIDPNDTTSFVKIRSITNSIFEGEFQLVFLLSPDRRERHPHLPDTVRFTDGVFRTKIMDVY